MGSWQGEGGHWRPMVIFNLLHFHSSLLLIFSESTEQDDIKTSSSRVPPPPQDLPDEPYIPRRSPPKSFPVFTNEGNLHLANPENCLRLQLL